MVLRSRARPRVYELGRRVAAGGMGEVYEATSADMNRSLAVKRVLEADASDEDMRLLFLREVAVAATLEDVHVVEVLDAGQFRNELFLIMEMVDGPSLAEIMEVLRREGKILPIEISCGIVSQIALGLSHAHERALPDGTPLGIVHRDIAPENVLIGTDGIPKIVDFGLAKLSGHSLTQPGIIRGRPRSLSPEQARGDHVDVRSDIFSLGAILFELLSGQTLYPDEQVATLLWKVAAGDYTPLRPRLGHIDPDLIGIIEQAVAIEPDERFRSAREMEKALDSFRAARGMRVSSRALAQVVSLTWPTIQSDRATRLEDTVGDLEGATLTLPADRVREDTTADVLNPSGDFDMPSAMVEKRDRKRAEAQPQSTDDLVAALSSHVGGTARSSPRPRGRHPAAFTSSELPRPERPARELTRGAGGPPPGAEMAWLVYGAIVLILAALAFGVVWENDESDPTTPVPTAHR